MSKILVHKHKSYTQKSQFVYLHIINKLIPIVFILQYARWHTQKDEKTRQIAIPSHITKKVNGLLFLEK